MAATNCIGSVFTSQLVTNLPAVQGVPFDSFPSAGVSMGGYFYFVANDGPLGGHGTELWRTDGTAGGTTLVKDILPGAAGSSPSQLVAAGTNVFFIANDGVNGSQLWMTDGTAGGTRIALQLAGGTTPNVLYNVYGMSTGVMLLCETYFTNRDLYFTDGQPNHTYQITGSRGFISHNPASLITVSGNYGMVGTYDSSAGHTTNRLWRMEFTSLLSASEVIVTTNSILAATLVGTNCYFVVPTNHWETNVSPASTNYYFQVALERTPFFLDAGPITQIELSDKGLEDAGYNQLKVIGGRLYYSDYTRSYSQLYYGPWKSIGQTGNAVVIEYASSGLVPLGAIGTTAYYCKNNNQVYQTDGTTAGTQVITVPVAPGASLHDIQQIGNQFFYDTFTYPAQIGVTDLTPGGTHLITNSVPGANPNQMQISGSLGSLLLFSSQNTLSGDEIYATDGTTAGTRLVKDIAPGFGLTAPGEATVAGGLLFFTLTTTNNGLELWRSDGTVPGTLLVRDIVAGPNSSGPTNLTACNGVLFFTANDGTSGTELWRSDGTAAGTRMVKDIWPGAAGSNPTELVAAGSLLYFVADDGTHGAELWQSDGTVAGTVLVQDVNPGSAPGNIRGLSAAGNAVYFLAGATIQSGQFWVSIAGSGSAQMLIDFGSMPNSFSGPFNYIAYAGKTYFAYYNGYAMTESMWVTDNTPTGTKSVAPMGSDYAVVNGMFLASGDTGLFTSDGTTAGTVLLTNLTAFGIPSSFSVVGTNLFFVCGAALWCSDGSADGTFPVAHFSGNQNPLYIPTRAAFQGALVFDAWAPLLGSELWCTAPGEGPTLIEDLSPQSGDANDLFLRPANNQLFYFANPTGQSSWQLRALHLQSLADPPALPFSGSPSPIPGLIEAENFDIGADGQAYHDFTADNEFGQYRPYAGVDINVCDDTGGGYCLSQTRADEWVTYTVQIAQDGTYQLDIRQTSSAVDTGYFRFELDGVFLGEFAVLNNGNAGGWFTQSSQVQLPHGLHKLRLYCEQPTSAGDLGQFNWFNFTLLQTNQRPTVWITYPPAGGILATDQPVIFSAEADDTTTAAPLNVEFFVDGTSLGVTNGTPPLMSWAPTPGAHNVYAVATDSYGLSTTSSNVLFFVAPPVLDNGSLWRANAFGTNVPNSWHQLTFDDSKWVRARAPFGFGYPVRTLTPSNYNNAPIPTFYFRQIFTNDPSTFNYASITLMRDDAAVVWLNNQLLARINLSIPTVFTNLALTNVFNTADRTNSAVDIIPVPLSMLVAGSNVIAVEIHQGRSGGLEKLDMYFDLSLSTFQYFGNPNLSVYRQGNGVDLQWLDTFTGWLPQQSSNLLNWVDLTNTVNDSNGWFDVLLSPATQKQNFFRLRHPSP